MRAIVHHRYGPPDVLQLEDVAAPVPADDEVLVRIRATTVTRADAHVRSGKPRLQRLHSGLRRPKREILGHELAGEIEAVGAAVTEFAAGDRVFGALPYLSLRTGSHAELMCVPERFPIAQMPDGASFEDAAAICDGGFLALGGLRCAGVRAGERVLVYGATGSIGTAAVQLASHFGARVTAVCNKKNFDLVRSLGADETIDYLQEDFLQNGERYDVIFDAVGKKTFGRCRHSLAPGGRYIPSDGLVNAFWWLWTRKIGDKKVAADIPPHYRKQDVLFLKSLVESGEYRAVVDRVYPLEDVVEATRYVETQQKVGNVVLAVPR